MRLCEVKDEHEAIATFIEAVACRLKAQNERFSDYLNKFSVTYTTNLAATTDILSTVAAVRQAQEATHEHTKRFTETLPQLPPFHLDTATLRYLESKKGGTSISGVAWPSSSGNWGHQYVYDSESSYIRVAMLLFGARLCHRLKLRLQPDM